MKAKGPKEKTVLEVMLVVVCIGMTYLAYEMGAYRMVSWNLFFLPIVLSGYYLGRSSAGVLALFCALAVGVATFLGPAGLQPFTHAVPVGLAWAIWAAALGLTAILVGTLCDERAALVREIHDAYLGVVEVTSRYLQSGDARIKARSFRVAEMCRAVAEEMDLPPQQVDDVRVGALLFDLGRVEITTNVISRAVKHLQTNGEGDRHTFLGLDLVRSLGSVLRGTAAQLVDQTAAPGNPDAQAGSGASGQGTLGRAIIQAVRAFDTLMYPASGPKVLSAEEALTELRRSAVDAHEPRVIEALERVIARSNEAVAQEPALV